ncbi:hypothetical protein O6B96_01875 [Campylobacter ureolyticus]|uniref:hypothetical protein n=1 Tax=Campylobacter ureolyticus TaxID=827 RepID=UPI0022B4B641|nr:hypothetical protein [Campylobacter ureolyticus]MCZ6149803.1 hypothetical protein [Campylobacter ureolyticus]
MQNLAKFRSISDMHEWAKANNALNFRTYKEIYELKIKIYDEIVKNDVSHLVSLDGLFDDEKLVEFINPKMILFLSISIPITLAHLKIEYAHNENWREEMNDENRKKSYNTNDLYDDYFDLKESYKFINLTPRVPKNPKDFRNGNIVAKHGAYQTDLHWLCQKEIGLLAEMLKESRYSVSQVCQMSSNITLQILQRRLESDFLKYLER